MAAGGAKKQLKFRQIMALDYDGHEQVLGLTIDGRVYQRQYHLESGQGLWFPLPTVSSTESQAFKCEQEGCSALIEYLPGYEEKSPDFCPDHIAERG